MATSAQPQPPSPELIFAYQGPGPAGSEIDLFTAIGEGAATAADPSDLQYDDARQHTGL